MPKDILTTADLENFFPKMELEKIEARTNQAINFRCTEPEFAMVQEMQTYYNCSLTKVIRAAIRKMYGHYQETKK